MGNLAQIQQLNSILLEEMPEYRKQAEQFPAEETAQQRLLRSLMNVRRPKPVPNDFLVLQDEYLQKELAQKGVVDISDLTPITAGIYLWQGDITTLRCDAIVNAANSGLTGCYIPCHCCIDNCIHTYAGVQLRQECATIMEKQGHEEQTGTAKITGAYNLPCKYILHTVGPIISGPLTARDEELLASCYHSCLELAEHHGVKSIAFCCISTGEFHFPNDSAAKIAVQTVNHYKFKNKSNIKVIFNVFKDADKRIYQHLLAPGRAIDASN